MSRFFMPYAEISAWKKIINWADNLLFHHSSWPQRDENPLGLLYIWYFLWRGTIYTKEEWISEILKETYSEDLPLVSWSKCVKLLDQILETHP